MANNADIKNLDVLFFGEVDDWGFASGFFAETLAQNEGEELEFLINSPGGAVFEGINIASILQRREGKTITTATGLAASIATVILLAGDRVQMDKDAFLMIHDAWAYEAGDAKELRKTARLLDKISAQIATIYTEQIAKAGKLIDGDKEKTREKMRQLMRAETWLTAQEALNIGLIDTIVDARKVEEEELPMPTPGNPASDPQSKFFNALKKYKNTPSEILNAYKMCDCKNKSVKNGARLTSVLNNAVDEMTDEETSRADIIRQLSSAAGIKEDTVNAILNNEIDCPPINRLEAFAGVLDISMDSIISAGRADGCAYGEAENQAKMKDKKSLWQSIKAFFAPELKAEIEAAQLPEAEEEQPTTTENENNEEMTIEEMKAALLKEGFEVSEKQPEKVEEKAEETTDINAELLAELKAMKEKQSKLEAALKDAQFAKAGKSAAGKGEEKETEKGPNVGAQNKAAFASLAALITE